MMNKNANQKFSIPLNSAGTKPASSTPAPTKMFKQAQDNASAAIFTPPQAHTPLTTPQKNKKVGRPKSTKPKAIPKTVYFSATIFKALEEMKNKGRNVSTYLDNLVGQNLGLYQ